jgi:hypothetical protein
VTTLLSVLATAAGFAAFAGALLGCWAWAHDEGDRQALVLRRAKWLYLPGLMGMTVWAVIVAYGALTRGCDPLFGGWTRPIGSEVSRLPPCP